MPATLLRASSATVLCHPIPGATPMLAEGRRLGVL